MLVRFLSMMLAIATCLAMSIGFSAPLSAHQTARSNTIIHIKPDEQKIDFLLSVATPDIAHHLELTAESETPTRAMIEAALPQVITLMDEHLIARNNGEICTTEEARIVRPDAVPLTERMNFLKAVHCADALGKVVLENRVMLDTPGGYRHFGRIQVGEEIHATVFDTQFPEYTLNFGSDEAGEIQASANVLDTFLRYLWQGILHILIGLDHVLFVICLLLAARGFRQLLFIITAFTVGHSVTLVLSALSIFTLSDSLIEPIIALSIAYVAAENLLRRREIPYLYVTALIFGLVHGFGFSYVLRDDLGLPTEALIPALVSFNLGVELGQVAIVALAYPLIKWARDKTFYPAVLRWSSASILVLALYWGVTRIFF